MKQGRIIVLASVFLIIAAVIMGRLFYVQVLQGKLYQAQALGQQSGFTVVKGVRGSVFLGNSKDSKGAVNSGQLKTLAMNQETWTAYAIPKTIANKNQFATALAHPLNLTKDFIGA